MGIAGDLIIILIAGLAAGLAAARLGVPALIGYIIAGIIIGPHTGGITVSDIPQIELLSEIGVALLLFSIGLDFSFRELRDVRKIALAGTSIQLVISVLFGFALGKLLGWSWGASVVLGMVISLSSTMVVMKTIMARGLNGTLSARVMIGILIVQDLAAIPMMIIIPRLGDTGGHLEVLIPALVKATLVLGVVVIAGVKLIPVLLRQVALLDSREMFLVTVTAIALGVGYITHALGLSLAFGAFVAGMVVNNSDYAHQALGDIIPLRDIFGLIFFTSLGMLLDPRYVMDHFPLVAGLSLFVIFGKGIIFFILSLAFRYRNIMPLALGLGLSQIGEFSLVLGKVAGNSGVIDGEQYSLVLAVSLITMTAAPFLARLAAPLYALKKKYSRSEPVMTLNEPEGGLSNHVIIAGGGRLGHRIATVFHSLLFPCVVLEQDYRRFEKVKDEGLPVIYGDASKESVLQAAVLSRARLLIITIPAIDSAREIISQVKKSRPDLRVIVRSDGVEHLQELYRLDVYEVVQPEFEASLEILRQALLHFDVSVSAIQSFTDEVRRENYMPLVDNFPGSRILSELRNMPCIMETSWFDLPGQWPEKGKSISEMAVRSATGASIIGVLRDTRFIPNPEAAFILQKNDRVALIGTPESKRKFEDLIYTV